jgi:hypothetical protein
MTWIEQEHGWVAASEEIVMAPSKEGFEERKRRAVCDKASTHGIGGLGVLVLVRAWHQAIVDIDGESLKSR